MPASPLRKEFVDPRNAHRIAANATARRLPTYAMPGRLYPSYTWEYEVVISNQGRTPVQLIGRRWQVATGDAIIGISANTVAGEHRIIQPGQSFRYSTGISIQQPSARMWGEIELWLPEEKKRAIAEVDEFVLPMYKGRLNYHADIDFTEGDVFHISEAIARYEANISDFDTGRINLPPASRLRLERELFNQLIPGYLNLGLDFSFVFGVPRHVQTYDHFLIKAADPKYGFSIRAIASASPYSKHSIFKRYVTVIQSDFVNIERPGLKSGRESMKDNGHSDWPLAAEMAVRTLSETYPSIAGPLHAMIRAAREGGREISIPPAREPVRELTAEEISKISKLCEDWNGTSDHGVIGWVADRFKPFIPGLLHSHLRTNMRLYKAFIRAVERSGGLPEELDIPTRAENNLRKAQHETADAALKRKRELDRLRKTPTRRPPSP